MRLMIASPSNRDWKPQFGISLCGLVADLTTRRFDYALSFYLQSSLLSASRQNIVDEAIKGNFDYLLTLDDDMSFQPDALHLMLSRPKKDALIANYVQKNMQKQPVTEDELGHAIFSKNKTGVERVFQGGLGFALLDVNVLKTLPKPLFSVAWLAERESYIGEDIHFFGLLAAQGKEVWVDHDASKLIGHVGDIVYRED